MEQNICLIKYEYFKIIYYLYHLKALNILVVLLELICGNLIECKRKY